MTFMGIPEDYRMDILECRCVSLKIMLLSGRAQNRQISPSGWWFPLSRHRFCCVEQDFIDFVEGFLWSFSILLKDSLHWDWMRGRLFLMVIYVARVKVTSSVDKCVIDCDKVTSVNFERQLSGFGSGNLIFLREKYLYNYVQRYNYQTSHKTIVGSLLRSVRYAGRIRSSQTHSTHC